MSYDKRGASNPNWKGGKITKHCLVCQAAFKVTFYRRNQAKFCGMKCVGKSQQGERPHNQKRVAKACAVCGREFCTWPSQLKLRATCRSDECKKIHRSRMHSGPNNPSWRGGVSKHGYPWWFQKISKRIIALDGGRCQNPFCYENGTRMSTHHINHERKDCREENLIALCTSCNVRANHRRELWRSLYQQILPFIRNGTMEINHAE